MCERECVYECVCVIVSACACVCECEREEFELKLRERECAMLHLASLQSFLVKHFYLYLQCEKKYNPFLPLYNRNFVLC